MSSPCVVRVQFPAAILNRPSLGHAGYRIGRYSDFRAHMLEGIDRAVLLRGWTYRGADDPGIALIEGAAILGDILTFYQELYANEAWLRTATWPQSIASLVRLIGYRPAPGLGGTGVVAFEINGNAATVIPAGLPFSAQLQGQPAPSNFETAASIVAQPSLSRLTLFAPSKVPGINAHASQVAATAEALAVAGVTLKKGDRLMLVGAGAVHQIAVVASVETVQDQTIIGLTGAWQGAAGNALIAFKLNRTFRSFGCNAPRYTYTGSGSSLTSVDTNTKIPLGTLLERFPLERAVNDLSAGITMLVDIPYVSSAGQLFRAYTVSGVASGTCVVGPLAGSTTMVQFADTQLPPGLWYTQADRRTAVCHEVAGRAFGVRGARVPDPAAAEGEFDILSDGATYQALSGRLLQLVAMKTDDTADRVEESYASIDRAQIGGLGQVSLRRLSLAPTLTQFTRTDFPARNPGVVVFGNVVPMTQGKTQASVVLGNGDARQVFQSFQLPKAPLTWLADEARTPPRDPQVTILVNQIEWTEVESLFGSGPNDQSYILREDDDGNTWVQFGNGINGANLPSGVNNVTATYRTGNAANGWRQSGARVQANARVANLGAMRLYDEVTGGSADEDPGHAQAAAPGTVQELGRIVSLSDFEFEALSLPGVEKARAVWDTDENLPLLTVTVLLSDNSAPQLAKVQACLSQANTERGAGRFPVQVLDASLDYVFVAATVGLVPGYPSDDVIAAARAALGVLPGDGSDAPARGLFSVDARRLGEAEYATRIEGILQNVPGIAWAEVTALCDLGAAEEPQSLNVPAAPPLNPVLACAGNRLLALYDSHCHLAPGNA